MEVIQIIYPRILSLRPRIAESAGFGDLDTYKGITRIFAEAGEAWVVMIARLPAEFRGLVESVLECCARDQDRDAIALTFLFWYEMKQIVTLDKYKQARIQYADIFGKLVDVMIKHLEYPTPDSANETDLFDGDREQEEKFREFRHQMGDVLKDCCDVITVTECLGKAFNRIQRWVNTYGSQATSTSVPHWQELEAPLFSMRAMGGMVSPEESVVLRQVIPLIVQIPDHEKLRFQATMALGRYTDWTAQHPEFLQPQLQFVIAGFSHSSKEVVRAAALAFKFFGTDCRKLLEGSVTELHSFYESVLDNLSPDSQEEITEGVACIISAQALDKVQNMFKMYCDPIIKRMMSCANQAKTAQDDGPRIAVAGKAYRRKVVRQLLTSHSRIHPTSYCLRPKYPAIRSTAGSQSGGQLLPRDIASSVRNRGELYQLHSYSGTCVPMLAVHGSFLPDGHPSSSTHTCATVGIRL